VVKSRKRRPRTYNPTIDVLLLCTANQCRSPMAEVLLRHHLQESGVDATVSSAGLYEGGVGATRHGVATMADRGLDLEDHKSRQVDAAMVREADLIIGMAREHVREAAVLQPDALRKTFTLKELVHHGSAIDPRRDDEPLSEWLGRVADDRDPGALVGVGHDDALDVADPIGRGRSDYEDTADLLDQLLARVVALAFPAADRQQGQRA
jgi:protein-tyrosine phosphatase